MSVIDRKPFINKVLDDCSSDQLKLLLKLVNGEVSHDNFKSLVPQSPNALTDDLEGTVTEMVLEVFGQAQTLYKGYLVYTEHYCTLIAYSSKKAPQLTLVNMDLVEYGLTGLWKFRVMPCDLTTVELRMTLNDALIEIGDLGDLVKIEEVENLPATGDEDTIYLAGSNIVDPVDGPVTVPNPRAQDAGKAIVVDEDGEYALGAAGLSENQVKGLIQADKNILSQIVYDLENGTILFPKNVLPLRISNDDAQLYLDYEDEEIYYGSHDWAGDLDFTENGILLHDFDDAAMLGTIVDMDYILFNGGYTHLNAYYLYFPITEPGTKLYKHAISGSFTDEDSEAWTISGYIISTSSTKLLSTDGSNLPYRLNLNTTSFNLRISNSSYKYFVLGTTPYDEIIFVGDEGSGSNVVIYKIDMTVLLAYLISDTITEL